MKLSGRWTNGQPLRKREGTTPARSALVLVRTQYRFEAGLDPPARWKDNGEIKPRAADSARPDHVVTDGGRLPPAQSTHRPARCASASGSTRTYRPSSVTGAPMISAAIVAASQHPPARSASTNLVMR